MIAWEQLVLIAVAGGIGAGLRYGLDALVMRGRRGVFPIGIAIVNLTGSLALGVVTGLGSAIAGDWATILGAGLLGGYTTFSTVSAETVLLAQAGRRDWAWANLLGTLVGCVVAAAIGLALGRLVGAWLPG